MSLIDHYPFDYKPLPYAYNALEPYIDEMTMRIHHDRLYQNYTNKLNKLLEENPKLQKLTLGQLINIAPRLGSDLGTAIAHNAGGVYNHLVYFYGMSPDANQTPEGDLAKAIDKSFGSYDAFLNKMNKEGLSVFGSGYAWLVSDRLGNLKIVTTANQGTPLNARLCPILNLDVWEHAYFLQYYDERETYICQWQKIINWREAEARYKNCLEMK